MVLALFVPGEYSLTKWNLLSFQFRIDMLCDGLTLNATLRSGITIKNSGSGMFNIHFILMHTCTVI